MVGIRDIANRAGVSISTVSYALNGSNKVTEETRARITKIADEMKYIPNMAGRTLKKQKTNIIGVYLADFGGYFYSRVVEGISDTLKKRGYELIICNGEKSHLFIPQKLVDGGIVLDPNFSTEEIEKYTTLGFPIVAMDRLSEEKIISVTLDNQGGATLAIDYLVTQRVKKFVLVTGPKVSFDSKERFDRALLELKRYDDVSWTVIEGDFTVDSGKRAGEKIKEIFEPGMGVFALNDEMALGIFDALRDSDIVIGENLKLIGFDNDDIGQYIQPSFSTINYSKYKWGSLAADKLVKLIEKKPAENEIIYTTLIPR